jgi:hypothetical protein
MAGRGMMPRSASVRSFVAPVPAPASGPAVAGAAGETRATGASQPTTKGALP